MFPINRCRWINLFFSSVLMQPWMACDKHDVSSDGNLLNFGNADATGANVNRNNPDNSNANLGVVSSRRNQISKSLSCGRLLESKDNCVSGATFGFLISLIQLPIMRPISSAPSESSAYPASLRHLVPCASRKCIKNILRMMSILLIMRSLETFCLVKAK